MSKQTMPPIWTPSMTRRSWQVFSVSESLGSYTQDEIMTVIAHAISSMGRFASLGSGCPARPAISHG